MATIYEEKFGLKPMIMAAYPFGTKQGGGRMHPEAIEAMSRAAECNIDLVELLERAGKKIADMVGCECAFITAGACAGLALSTAAAMTGLDVRLMEQLPNTEYPFKMKNEVIMQLGHITHYVGCFKTPGAKVVEVGGGYLPRGPSAGSTWEEFSRSWDKYQEDGNIFHPLVWDEGKKKYIRVLKVLPGHIENAINERTAAIAYVGSWMCVRGEYEVSLDETVKIAKRYNLPVIVDFAANAGKRKYLKLALEKGADLVVFSGGKDICGPNDTGIVLGRKDLVDAVRHNSTPHYRIVIGRGLKVSKEQVVGLMVALEKYFEIDEEAQFQNDLASCKYIASKFENFPHVRPSVYMADEESEGIFYKFPQVHLKIDEKALGIKASQVSAELMKGDPQILLNKYLCNWGIVEIITRGLRDGEADIVVDRVKEVLSRNLKK